MTLIADLNTLLASPKTSHIIAYTNTAGMAAILADSTHDFAYNYQTSTLSVKTGGAWVAASADIAQTFTSMTVGQDPPDPFFGILNSGVMDITWPPAIGSGNIYVVPDWTTAKATGAKTGELAVINDVSYMLGMTPSGVPLNWVKLKASTSGSSGQTVNTQAAAYTLVAADSGKLIAAGGNVTVPTNVFTPGASLRVYNNTDNPINIVTTGLLSRVNGRVGASTSNSLDKRGYVTIQFITTTDVILDGNIRTTFNSPVAAYTLVASDIGKIVKTASGITVPTDVFVAGDTIKMHNSSDTAITITTTGLTAYVVGKAGAITLIKLDKRGVGNITFLSATEIVLDGTII